MNEGLKMVHLRTVSGPWEAKVIAARLGAEGIVTHLRGNLSGPYPFGVVSVLVEEGQAELAAALLLADEVEAALADATPSGATGPGSEEPAAQRGHLHDKPLFTWKRAAAALAALAVAGAPLLAHFAGS